MYIRDEGIICRKIAYSESSWILKIFTPMHGMISLIAKGARRQKSRFGGKTEVFTYGEFQWYESRNSDLHTLTEVAIKDHYQLDKDLDILSNANVMVDLLLKIHSDPRPDLELFDVAKRGVEYLNKTEGSKLDVRFLSRFYLKVLQCEGHGIQFSNCGQCGNAVEKVSRFSTDLGSFICRDCLTDELEDGNAQRLFNFVSLKNEMPTLQELYKIEKFLLDFMGHHFGRELNLKSYDFLDELRKGNHA
jgi:DNA repair protein RecO (recombination protein O)